MLFPAITLTDGRTSLVRETWRFDLGTEEWEEAEPLPERFFLSDATAIEDTVFAVGGFCEEATPDSPEDECRETALLRSTGGNEWSSMPLTPTPLRPGQFPDGVFRVGDSSVGIGVSGDPQRTLVVLDVESEEWTDVPAPSDRHENVAVCATNGSVFAREASTGMSVDDDGVERRYEFEVWALQGLEWSRPVEVDLGVVTPREGVGGSELCSGGSFVGSNTSDDGVGVAVHGGDPVTTAPATVPVPTAGARHSSGVAGIFDQRSVVTVEGGNVVSIELPDVASLREGSLLAASEWQDRVDLLIADGETTGPVPVRLASRARSPQRPGNG